MSPEQITGEPIDKRTDLYSLGAVLYVLLTGKRPIIADTIAAYLARQLAQEPRRPALIDPQVPAILDRICTRLLRKESSQRFASAEETLAALDSGEADERPPLYGRDSAIGRIRALLDLLEDGGCHVLGFVGKKGAGLSAMLREAQAQAQEQGRSFSLVDPQKGLAEAVSRRPESGPWLLLADSLDRIPEWEVRDLSVLFDAPKSPIGLIFTAQAHTGELDLTIQNLGVRELLALPFARTELLPPLDRGDIISLLRDRGLSSTVAALLGKRLHEEFGGYPALLVEQLDALVNEGWLERKEAGGLKPAQKLDRLRKDPLPLPEAVRIELEHSLMGLETEERSQLVLLAVLGGQASTDLLGRLAGLGVDRLGRLQRNGLVEVEEEGLHKLLKLSSPRLRQVLLEDLKPSERARLHLEVAEALATTSARRLGPLAEVVAQHFLEANCPDRAWPLLVEAAQRGIRRNQFPQVLSLTRRAREAADSMVTAPLDEETTRLHQRTLSLRGRAMLATGRFHEARDCLQESLSLGLPTEGREGRNTRAALGAAMVETAESKQAVIILEPLLQELEPGDPVRFQTVGALGNAMRLEGRLDESLAVWKDGCEAARQQGLLEQEGLFLLGLGQTLKISGRLPKARKVLQSAENRLRTRDSRELASCLVELGDLDLLDGSYRRALARAEDASAIAQQIDDLGLSADSLTLCASALEAVGMERDASRLSAEADGLRRAREAEGPLPISSVTPAHDKVRTAIAEAQQHMTKDNSQAAQECLETAIENLPSSGCRGLELQVNARLAKLSENQVYRERASELARLIMDTLPPELAAAFGSREELAELLG